jgi:hypothetical protein
MAKRLRWYVERRCGRADNIDMRIPCRVGPRSVNVISHLRGRVAVVTTILLATSASPCHARDWSSCPVGSWTRMETWDYELGHPPRSWTVTKRLVGKSRCFLWFGSGEVKDLAGASGQGRTECFSCRESRGKLVGTDSLDIDGRKTPCRVRQSHQRLRDIHRRPGRIETLWRWEAIQGPLAHREVQMARGDVEPETDSLVTRLLLAHDGRGARPSNRNLSTPLRLAQAHSDSLVTRLLLAHDARAASPSSRVRLTLSRLVRAHGVVEVAGRRLDCEVRTAEFWRADGTPTSERRTYWISKRAPGGTVRELDEERAPGQELVLTHESRLLDYGLR